MRAVCPVRCPSSGRARPWTPCRSGRSSRCWPPTGARRPISAAGASRRSTSSSVWSRTRASSACTSRSWCPRPRRRVPSFPGRSATRNWPGAWRLARRRSCWTCGSPRSTRPATSPVPSPYPSSRWSTSPTGSTGLRDRRGLPQRPPQRLRLPHSGTGRLREGGQRGAGHVRLVGAGRARPRRGRPVIDSVLTSGLAKRPAPRVAQAPQGCTV